MATDPRSPTRETADIHLDITADVCPITFVKTKLMIEGMESGMVGEVRLNDGEPLRNVPRSVVEHGHTVVSLEPEEEGGRVWRLVFRKE